MRKKQFFITQQDALQLKMSSSKGYFRDSTP